MLFCILIFLECYDEIILFLNNVSFNVNVFLLVNVYMYFDE